MDIKKNLSKFLLLGVSALALGGFAFSNSDSIKNTVDQQLFSHLEVTAFQNIEDVRLAHIKNEIKNIDKMSIGLADQLNINYGMLKDNIKEPDYKEALKDKDFYKDDLATLKAVKDDYNAPVDMSKYAKDLPDPDLFTREEKTTPVILKTKLEEYKPSANTQEVNNDVHKVSVNHGLQNYDDIKNKEVEKETTMTVNRTSFFSNLKELKKIYLDGPTSDNKNTAKIN